MLKWKMFLILAVVLEGVTGWLIFVITEKSKCQKKLC